MPTKDLGLDALRHARWSVPASADDLRQMLGDERLVPRIEHELSAFELLDRVIATIEHEPACFTPDDAIGTPERSPHCVWLQQPANGVVASIPGWIVLLTRGWYRPSDVLGACEGRGGVVGLALDILGFSWDDDEAALDALLGSTLVQGVGERAAEGVERIRRFQAAHEDRLCCRWVFNDAAQEAASTRRCSPAVRPINQAFCSIRGVWSVDAGRQSQQH